MGRIRMMLDSGAIKKLFLTLNATENLQSTLLWRVTGMGKQLEIRRANLNPCRGPKKGPLKFCMNQGVLSTSMLLFSNLFGAYSYQVERIPKLFFFFFVSLKGTFLVAQAVKNMPAMQEIQVWSLGWENPLEKGMAIHFSILAWRIPWTEPGSLQILGSQGVGHDWATNTFFHFFFLQNSYFTAWRFDGNHASLW